MRFRSAVLFIVILPFFFLVPVVDSYGFLFSSIYFFLITLFCWINYAWLIKNGGFFLERKHLSTVIAFVIAILLTVTDQLRYSKPIFFLFVMFTIFIGVNITKTATPVNAIRVVVNVFVLFALILVFFPSRYTFDGRYFSFLITPTVFSVYADAILILSFSMTRDKLIRISILIVVALVVYLSKTRINLLVTALIPVLFVLLERTRLSRELILYSFLFTLFFIYPLYQYARESGYFDNFLLLRSSGSRDASFDMRFYLHAVSMELFLDGTWLEKLFGHGSEFSRLYILNLTNEDSYSHNDFLRILIDFGVVFGVAFIGLMVKIASKNNVSTVLLILYVTSFYHNMIFDFYLPCLIILFAYFRYAPESHVIQNTNFKAS